MYRIDDPTASTTLPTPEAALTEGYFTEGNPGTGTPATLERASWFNMVQEELRAIPVAAGLTPSKTTYNQILTALKAMFSPVVGSVRNLVMSVTAASATATLTADQIVVATALNGQTFILPSFNKTIILTNVGANGMDTGSAPASAYVSIYAIYNPTTQTAALLAQSNTGGVKGNVYGGANMPAGYTASALLTIVPTNGSGQIVACNVADRWVDTGFVQFLATTTQNASFVSVNTGLPANAKSARIRFSGSASAAATFSCQFCGNSNGIGGVDYDTTLGSGNSIFTSLLLNLQSSPTLYYIDTVTSGTIGFNAWYSGYGI